MNRIRIWCPFCKEYESVLLNGSNFWVTKRCGSTLKSRESEPVIGLDGLNKVLMSGVWTVNRKIRKPPAKKIMENSK